MISTEHWLVHEHTLFESALGRLRTLTERNDWDGLADEMRSFVDTLATHMAQEEEVIFPAYERRAGELTQPTETLRDDHDHINEIVREVVRSINARDASSLDDTLPYMESVMLSHHEKEELIFLPMASHILFEDREMLAQKLDAFEGPTKHRDWGYN